MMGVAWRQGWLAAAGLAVLLISPLGSNAAAVERIQFKLTAAPEQPQIAIWSWRLPHFDVDRTVGPDTTLSEVNYESHLHLQRISRSVDLGAYFRSEWPSLESSTALIEQRRSIGFRLFLSGGSGR